MNHPEAPTPELLRSLGRMLRGLSALFWGLPLTLIISVQSQTHVWAQGLGLSFVLPSVTHGLLFFGLTQMSWFQPQERVWRNALDRARLTALVNVGLAPFLYFRVLLPQMPHYAAAVDLLYFSSLLFLYNYNQVLFRLSLMLPDESLRRDVHLLAELNHVVLIGVALLGSLYLIVWWTGVAPTFLYRFLQFLDMNRLLLAVLPLLLPVAMMMTLTWRIKELVMDGVFSSAFWQR